MSRFNFAHYPTRQGINNYKLLIICIFIHFWGWIFPFSFFAELFSFGIFFPPHFDFFRKSLIFKRLRNPTTHPNIINPDSKKGNSYKRFLCVGYECYYNHTYYMIIRIEMHLYNNLLFNALQSFFYFKKRLFT